MANTLYRARAEKIIERGRGWSVELPRFIDYRPRICDNLINSNNILARGIEICFTKLYYN